MQVSQNFKNQRIAQRQAENHEAVYQHYLRNSPTPQGVEPLSKGAVISMHQRYAETMMNVFTQTGQGWSMSLQQHMARY